MPNPRAAYVAQSKVLCGPCSGFRCTVRAYILTTFLILIILNCTFLMQVVLSATLSRLYPVLGDFYVH